MAMAIKAHDTFWQRRNLRGMQPKLLEVLKVEEVIGTRDICQVRWHILSKDSVSTSEFLMASITEGHFADFVPIPHGVFLKAQAILNDPVLDYPRRKLRILYLMRKYHYTDDEPYSLVSRASNEHVTPQTSDLPSMRTSATKEAP